MKGNAAGTISRNVALRYLGGKAVYSVIFHKKQQNKQDDRVVQFNIWVKRKYFSLGANCFA